MFKNSDCGNFTLTPYFSYFPRPQFLETDTEFTREMQERPELRGQLLTLPAADAIPRSQLDELKPRLAGKA